MTTSHSVESLDTRGQVIRRLTIDAPASRLYDLVSDPNKHHLIDGSGTVGNVKKSDAKLAVGSTFTVAMKMHGLRYSITSTVTQACPDGVFEWRHPFRFRWRWEFQESAEGTIATHTFDYRNNLLSPVFKLLGVPKTNGEGMAKSLIRLDELAHQES